MPVVYKVGDRFVDANGNEVDAPKDEQASENAPVASPEATGEAQGENASQTSHDAHEAAENGKPAKRTIQKDSK